MNNIGIANKRWHGNKIRIIGKTYGKFWKE